MPRPLTLERPWGAMRVWASGHGPTVLAIHGLGGSGRYWDRLGNALDGEFRILAPDLAGFGNSATPNAEPLRELHLADLAAVVDTFGEGEPIVVGHSLGGVLAAMFAARRPQTPALAVVASPFPGDDDLDFRHLHDGAPAWRRRTIQAARWAWPVLAWPAAVAKGLPYPVVRDFGRQSFRSRVVTMWSVLSDPAAAEELEPLRHREAPSLVLTALDDDAVPPVDRQRWAAAIPAADQVILAAGGHQLLFRTGFTPLADWVRRVTAR